MASAESAPKIFPNLTQSPHTSPFLGLRPPQLSELQWKGQGQASTASLCPDWHESSIISCPALLPRSHTVGVPVSCCVPLSDTQTHHASSLQAFSLLDWACQRLNSHQGSLADWPATPMPARDLFPIFCPTPTHAAAPGVPHLHQARPISWLSSNYWESGTQSFRASASLLGMVSQGENGQT